ncbi:MAG: hypothetical protein ACWGMZ_03360 [Thermoguttaceae bacterium]
MSPFDPAHPEQGKQQSTTLYAWDTAQLYTTGYITLVPEPAMGTLLLVTGLALACFSGAKSRSFLHKNKKRTQPLKAGN